MIAPGVWVLFAVGILLDLRKLLVISPAISVSSSLSSPDSLETFPGSSDKADMFRVGGVPSSWLSRVAVYCITGYSSTTGSSRVVLSGVELLENSLRIESAFLTGKFRTSSRPLPGLANRPKRYLCALCECSTSLL